MFLAHGSPIEVSFTEPYPMSPLAIQRYRWWVPSKADKRCKYKEVESAAFKFVERKYSEAEDLAEEIYHQVNALWTS